MGYSNELVEEGIGKLVYVRAIGAGEGPDQEQLQGLIEDPSQAFSAPLQTATWLARLDGYDAVGVRFRMPRDAPAEGERRGYFVPWSRPHEPPTSASPTTRRKRSSESSLGAFFVAGETAVWSQQGHGEGDPGNQEACGDGEREVVAAGQCGGGGAAAVEQAFCTRRREGSEDSDAEGGADLLGGVD